MIAENDDVWSNAIFFDIDTSGYEYPKIKEVLFVGGPRDGEVHTLADEQEGNVRMIHLAPGSGADTSKAHPLVEVYDGTYIIKGNVARYVDPEEQS